MTLPSERLRSLKQMRKALWEFSRRPGPIRKRELRQLVSILTRHYPAEFEIDRYWKEEMEKL